jgi:hypothetical protein
MADFRSIAAGIFEKDRVVARPFIYPWPSMLQASAWTMISVSRSTLLGLSASEGDSAFVHDMP